MKKKIDVSIIVPVYNVEKWIKECLESLINQTYCDYEIILINDGSTDDSGKICDQFATINPSVQVLHQINQGVSVARNKGLSCAKGKYVVFVDPDDIVSKKYLEILVTTIESSNSEMVITNYCSNYEKFLFSNVEKVKAKEIKSEDILEHILDGKSYDGYLWNRIFVRSIINDNYILFNKNIIIWEDLYFVIEYLRCIKKCVYIDYVLYFYRQRIDSAVSSTSIEKLNSKIKVCRELMNMDIYKKSIFYNNSTYLYVIYLTEYGYFLSKNKSLTRKQANEICNELRKYKYIMPRTIKYFIKYLIISMRCII